MHVGAPDEEDKDDLPPEPFHISSKHSAETSAVCWRLAVHMTAMSCSILTLEEALRSRQAMDMRAEQAVQEARDSETAAHDAQWKWLPEAIKQAAEASRPALAVDGALMPLHALPVFKDVDLRHLTGELHAALAPAMPAARLVQLLPRRPELQIAPDGFVVSDTWMAERAATRQLAQDWPLFRASTSALQMPQGSLKK